MVALSPLLHSWWSKGYFAFKYLGSDPAEAPSSLAVITLQFRWMPRSSVQNGTHIVKLEDQRDPGKGLLAGLNHHYGDGVSADCNTERCTGCYRTSLVGVTKTICQRRMRHLLNTIRKFDCFLLRICSGNRNLNSPLTPRSKTTLPQQLWRNQV